ncbi:MAG: GyrI-like domain-containing protein [Coprobacillaceae bacterium]
MKMKYDVILKEIPERNVMSIRQVVSEFSDEGTLWNALYTEAQKQKVEYTNPPLGMTLYHDPEYKEKDIDIEVQSTIVGDYNDTEVVKFFKAPAIEVVSITFKGSHEQMPTVMQEIAKWLEINNYVISGPMINIFHVTSATESNPDNWVTEASYQVTKRK